MRAKYAANLTVYFFHEEVEELLRNPTQIVSGDLEAFVAQTKRENGSLHAAFRAAG
jgi:hypothetical protein